MWFLQAEIAVRLFAAGAVWMVLAALAGRSGRQARLNRFLVVADIALLLTVSVPLTVFYVVYTAVTWLLTCLALTANRWKEGDRPMTGRVLFVVLCLLAIAPFLYLRAAEVLSSLPVLLTLVGFSYNMLKAVDGIYFVYYTGEPLDPVVYANYILFFPVFTAGPILRYRDFLRDMTRPAPITAERFILFLKRLIRGYFKKVVVLVLVSILLSRLAGLGQHVWLSVLVCLVSYLLLWLDMSGYADIAIALGGCMGFTVAENFKKPLQSPSFTQFWRNWHVSLTDWIREHIFVVLNGKKLSRYQGAILGFGTMMVMNFWHGMSKTFLLDGLLMGSMLAAENLLGISTVNRRKVKKSYFRFRCAVVTLLFAFDTIFYTLTPEELSNVLHGFLHL